MWLPRVIRHRFRLHQSKHRELGASFLIGSVSPRRNTRGLIPEAKLYAFRSMSNFQAEEISPGEAGSIGNGRGLEDPVREILKTNEFQIAWNAGPRMHSFILAHHLRNRVLSKPVRGVSPQFVMGWVVRGDQGIEPWTTLGAESKVDPERKVRLVRSLVEFEAMFGAGAADAVG